MNAALLARLSGRPMACAAGAGWAVDLASSLDPPPGRAARHFTTRPMQGTNMTEQTTTASTEQPAVTDPPASALRATPRKSPPAQPAPAAAPAVAPAVQPDPAAQAARLGVTVDAVDAMKRGVAPEGKRCAAPVFCGTG